MARKLSEIDKVKFLFRETGEKLLASASMFFCKAGLHVMHQGVYLNPKTQKVEQRIVCKHCGAL